MVDNYPEKVPSLRAKRFLFGAAIQAFVDCFVARHTPRHDNRKQLGFTLLEIIIALFVFSIVSMIVVGALHNVLTTQSVTEKKSRTSRQSTNCLVIDVA